MSVKTQASWNAHALSTRPGMPSDPQLFGCSPVWRIGLHPRQKAGVDSPLLQQPLEPLCMGGVVSLETSVKIILRSFRGSQLLKQKHRQKHLTWAKEKKNWTVTQWSKVLFQMEVNFAFHLEIKVPESGGRVERHRIHVDLSPVWSFHNLWWFVLTCHLLVLVYCVFWSPQSTQPSTRTF